MTCYIEKRSDERFSTSSHSKDVQEPTKPSFIIVVCILTPINLCFTDLSI